MRHYELSADTNLRATGLRFAIVASRYNRAVTDALLEGALGALEEAGADADHISVARVPGAFELPLALQQMLKGGGYDAAIALGCVIRGDTPHFEYVAMGATQGLLRVSLDTGVPIGFGLLTTETQAQAEERSRPDETNKGREAALTALEMALLIREM